MKKQTYNGWANYETWLVNLWLTEDPYTEELISEWAKEIEDYKLAQTLEDYVDDMADAEDIRSGLIQDLIKAAMSEVDWEEIAQHYIEDYR